MAIANGTCVSLCNQPKAHYLATVPHESHAGMSLPTADLRVQPAGIWLRQESKAHFALPWVRT